MCGIAGIYIKDPDILAKRDTAEKMERMLDHLLLGIENRGTDATGFVAASVDGKKFICDKAATEASSFVKVRKKFPDNTRVVLGHTRLKTKGDQANWMNNHPVLYKGVFVIHNGIIMNDDQLFKDEELERFAEVDTEIIAAILKKYGMKEPYEGLGKLRGGFACAAIDIANPEELLLFKKGGTNPLVIHENKQFLVWASTAKAIQEAWAKVLGTPPEWAKFEHLKDGALLRVNGDSVEMTEDAIKGDSFQSKSGWSDYAYGEWEDWPSCESPYLLERPSDSQASKFESVSDILKSHNSSSKLDECKKIVVKIKDKDRQSITWDNRLDLDKENKKLLGRKPQWDHCTVCKTTVARVTTKTHAVHGLICLDCYGFLTTITIISPAKVHGATEVEVIDGIEEWCQLEAYIHYKALRTVEDASGMTLHAIDYLLHRASEEYLKKIEISKIHDDLKNQYDNAIADAWEEYGESFQSNEEEETSAEIAIIGEWVTCAAGTHKISDECEACSSIESYINGTEKDDEEEGEFSILTGETIVGDKPNITNPESWGTFKREETRGVLGPRFRRNNGGKTVWHPGDPIKGREKRDGKCLLCPKNAKVLISQDFRWCSDHYKNCGIANDDKTECSNEPTGWDEFGIRRCHYHSRKIKNFLTQKSLINARNKGRSLATTRS